MQLLREGVRMYRRARRVHRLGWKRYPGTAKDICAAIVQDCFDGYFHTSLGHFSEFYCRDFGMCTESLLKLGYTKEVHETLAYALACFKKGGAITTTLSPEGKPFDFLTIGPDSLAFLIHALFVSKDKQLVEQYASFLNKEIWRYYVHLVDPTGLVKDNLFVSSIKDSHRRSSSCYDTCMLGLLAKELDALHLDNPFKKHEYTKLIMMFWNGSYFYEDMTKENVITGDANTFPFWCGLVSDKKIALQVIKTLHDEGLDEPFALKYTKSAKVKQIWIYTKLFAPNYEGNTIWMHLGLCYLDVLKKYDKKRWNVQKKKYVQLVEQHGNFLELFTTEGKPYHTFFYYADEGMLWAAKLLESL